CRDRRSSSERATPRSTACRVAAVVAARNLRPIELIASQSDLPVGNRGLGQGRQNRAPPPVRLTTFAEPRRGRGGFPPRRRDRAIAAPSARPCRQSRP